MAPQVLYTSVLRPSVAAGDEMAFLSPNDRSLHSPSTAKKRSAKRRLGSVRRRVCSSALFLIKKARELRIWHVGNDAAGAGSEYHRKEAVSVEPYFSIPVVVPVTAAV